MYALSRIASPLGDEVYLVAKPALKTFLSLILEHSFLPFLHSAARLL